MSPALRTILCQALIVIVAVSVSAAGPPRRVISGAGSFVEDAEGWRCTAIQAKFVPPLLAGLQVGDIVVRVGSLELKGKGPLQFSEALRRAELGFVTEAVVLRGGEQVRLVEPPPDKSSHAEVQLVTAQNSPEVLRSDDAQVWPGDRIEKIGGKSWKAIESAFRASAVVPFININFKPGTSVTLIRRGETITVTVQSAVTLVGVRMPQLLNEAGLISFLSGTTLRGLNASEVTLKPERGRWLLIHFWASWCRPCVAEAPSVAELAKRKDLKVVAVGYADSDERLREFASRIPGFAAYSADPLLTSEMAVNGIPYDVLISPEGRAVATISGTLPEGALREIILNYVEH